MKRNLFISILFAVLACVPLLTAQAQVSFNFMDTTNSTIRFAQPSPNGGLASVTFSVGANIPKTSTIVTVKAAWNVQSNMPVRIQWCPLTNGKYPPANAQTLPNPAANATQFPFVANATGMMVLQYQDSATAPWTSFDEVTVMDNFNNPVLNNAVNAAATGFTFSFKSKDGTKGASVIIIITSTTETPWMPPGHKK